VLDRAFENSMEAEEQATLPFVGGIRQHGYQCGQVWGATLAAGARMHQKLGDGPESELRALRAGKQLVDIFRERNQEVNCYEITHIGKESSALEMVKYFLLKGGSLGCLRMANRFAPGAYDAIEGSREEPLESIPAPPVSCTAHLAQRMGADPKHQTMAAGLAGGIGFSGEACGALGTAIWIRAMAFRRRNPEADLWKDPVFGSWFETLVERFLAASDYEFECASITGKTFASADEHAAYLGEGGCASIIEALSQDLPAE